MKIGVFIFAAVFCHIPCYLGPDSVDAKALPIELSIEKNSEDIDSMDVNIGEKYSFGISLTTIPPRFNQVHHTIISWLKQEYPPVCILIFVPKHYRRFKRKRNEDLQHSATTTMRPTNNDNAESLRQALDRSLKGMLSFMGNENEHLTNISVVEVPRDWGPATKLGGLLKFIENCADKAIVCMKPDFWLIGDDDVAYSQTTITRYAFGISALSQSFSFSSQSPTQNFGNQSKKVGFTHFSEDIRMTIELRLFPDFDGDITTQRRRVQHLQGVDTFLLPTNILFDEAERNLTLSYKSFTKVMKYLDEKCPESFYQDDYVISLLLHFAEFHMISLWNNDNVGKHVEGVSKSFNQMHMHADVFEREERTVGCLKEFANEIFWLLNQQYVNPSTGLPADMSNVFESFP